MQIFRNLANFPTEELFLRNHSKKRKEKKRALGQKGEETRDEMNGKQSRVVVCGCLLRNMLYGWGAHC